MIIDIGGRRRGLLSGVTEDTEVTGAVLVTYQIILLC